MTTFELDDDLVLYAPSTAQAHVLNSTAARIWALCDGSRSRSELVSDVASLYALDQAQAEADVSELLDRLQAAGLLLMV